MMAESCQAEQNHDGSSVGSNSEEEIDSQVGESQPNLSKNALKRLRRKEKFDRVKVFKRKVDREKRKQRYADAREHGVSLGPSRKALKRNLMKDSSRRETIVVDCDFDAYMAEKDIVKLVNQIQRCYSINRRFDEPVQFHVTGVGGKTKERLESVGDFRGWDIHFTEDSYTDVFDKAKLVYLSSESDQVLTELREDEVYVIGGLVDHNHHKGLCHRLALEKDIRHARLPIDEYVQLQSRRVLTIDQVFNILGQFLLLGKWEQAFHEVIPKRKGLAPLKGEKQESGLEKENVTEETKNGKESVENVENEDEELNRGKEESKVEERETKDETLIENETVEHE